MLKNWIPPDALAALNDGFVVAMGFCVRALSSGRKLQ